MTRAGTIADKGSGAFGESLRPGERLPAAYAASAVPSRGRRYPEPECTTRSPFQRDRDRVLHSTAFRRLIHKTQVFVFHEGDHFRTRLTHSLEVAQIARTIARQLRLDEDLAEALALAHDLGHPPFGHAGERALDFAMRNFGGFDHNAQSLRVVMHLERKYLAFDGLNLTWETLEGLAKHNGPLAPDKDDAAVSKVIKPLESWRSLEPLSFASAEAQVAALADDIAYLTHDIDDGLRAGLLAIDGLDAAPLAGRVAQETRASAAKRDEGRLTYEVTRRMITEMVRSVVAESRSRLSVLSPESPDDIRHAASAVVAFTQEMSADIAGLRTFLTARVYRSRRVMEVMDKATEIVRDLFARYVADPAAMPEAWQAAAAGLSDRRRARVIGDFVAGMTDRYAIAEHRRLFDATPELR
jgi:dGTPase